MRDGRGDVGRQEASHKMQDKRQVKMKEGDGRRQDAGQQDVMTQDGLKK